MICRGCVKRNTTHRLERKVGPGFQLGAAGLLPGVCDSGRQRRAPCAKHGGRLKSLWPYGLFTQETIKLLHKVTSLNQCGVFAGTTMTSPFLRR